jgi:hypothetical protein
MAEDTTLTPPVDPTPPAAEGGAGTGGAAETTPNPFFATFKERTGIEVASEDDIFTHYTAASQRAAERDQLEQQVRDLQGKVVEFPTEAPRQLAAFQQSLVKEGITDPVEINRRSVEFFREANTDYLQMAESNPAAVVEAQLRKKYSGEGFSPDDIARMVTRETRALTPPDIAKYGGDVEDPEYIAAVEAHKDAVLDFKLKARVAAKELEAAKPKLDFTPVNAMTPKQREELAQKQNADYAGSYTAFIDHVAANGGIKVGDQVVPLALYEADGKTPTPEFQAAYDRINVANPMEGFYLESGAPNAQALAEFHMLRAAFPKILAAEKAKAYELAKSYAVKEFEARIHNTPNPGTTNPPPGGERLPQTPEEMREHIRRQKAAHPNAVY